MARITKEARRHAALTRARRQVSPLDGLLDDDEELGSALGSLGRIAGGVAGTVVGGPAGTAIGSSLGGGLGDLLGGKGGGSAASSASKPSGKTGGSVATAPAVLAADTSSSVTRQDVRNIVHDSLAAHTAGLVQREAQRLQSAAHARETADQVEKALSPTAKRTRGAVQVQRLQAQATAEHRNLQRQQERERVGTERFTKTQDMLAKILVAATRIQQKLSGRVAVVRGTSIDVLGGDSLVRTR